MVGVQGWGSRGGGPGGGCVGGGGGSVDGWVGCSRGP